MATMQTETATVTIEAPFERVAADMADPTKTPEWAKEFFGGPATPAEDGEVGEYEVPVPAMGGEARYKIDADAERGVADMYVVPKGAPFGSPIPVRVVPNGDGADVLWTIARRPDMDDGAWEGFKDSIRGELKSLKRRHEAKRSPIRIGWKTSTKQL